MKERGISFSTALVPRVLDGSKTQTRRVIRGFNGPPEEGGYCGIYSHAEIVAVIFREGCWWFETEYGKQYPYRYVVPAVGDRLWIKEAFYDSGGGVHYRADGPYNPYAACDVNHGGYPRSCQQYPECDCEKFPLPWKSGRFMPKVLARDERLEIVRVGAERVQNISESDAKAEGVMPLEQGYHPARSHFMDLWNKLNAKRGYGWKENPWVWVYEWPPVTS